MLGARIKEGRHVEGRGRGWATLAGTRGVWTPAADSGYTHTHTHTQSSQSMDVAPASQQPPG